jgi:hypothetical protein
MLSFTFKRTAGDPTITNLVNVTITKQFGAPFPADYYTVTGFKTELEGSATIEFLSGEIEKQVVFTPTLALGLYSKSLLLFVQPSSSIQLSSNQSNASGVLRPDLPFILPIPNQTVVEGSYFTFNIVVDRTYPLVLPISVFWSSYLAIGETSAADLGSFEYYNGTTWVPPVNGQAFIPIGQTSVQVRILAIAEGFAESSEFFTLEVSLGDTRSQSAQFTILDDDLATLQTLNLSVTPGSTLEGNPAALQTLNLSVTPSTIIEGT